MLHILSCLEVGGHEVIEHVLRDILKNNENMDAMLTCFNNANRLLTLLDDIHDGENYLIIVGDFIDQSHTLALLNNIRHKQKNCYILFISRYPRLLHTVVNQNTRISGFVTTPLLDNTLVYLVKQAYRDYNDNNRLDADKLLAINIVRGTLDSRERVLIRVHFDDIYFIEASNRKTRYVLRSTVYTDNTSLTEREHVLDRRFIRCHNAFIVNVEKINAIHYGKSEIYLKNGDTLPISRAKKKYVKDALQALNISIQSTYASGEEVEDVR